MVKLQDVETTAQWHNIWLGCTTFFLATTGLFAGLFGGYYAAWDARAPCENGGYWVHGTGPDFDDACHAVGDDGLYAIPGASCPSECDSWWYKKHPISDTRGRRLIDDKDNDNPPTNAKIQNTEILIDDFCEYIVIQPSMNVKKDDKSIADTWKIGCKNNELLLKEAGGKAEEKVYARYYDDGQIFYYTWLYMDWSLYVDRYKTNLETFMTGLEKCIKQHFTCKNDVKCYGKQLANCISLWIKDKR